MKLESYTDLDPERIPGHIAIIMDGNGRWARRKGLPRLEGHRRGYATLRKIVESAADLEVKALTVYAFSSENWTRPTLEVRGLMELYRYAAAAELDSMKEEGVRFLVSGRVHEIPARVRKQLLANVEATRDNTKITLNLAINYGGRNEIVDAAREAAGMVARGEMKAEDIDSKLISSLMYQPQLPDPDLVIRTAGEMRISNFLLWEVSYSEFYATPTLWPDFDEAELVKAIRDYQGRTRKFGAVVEE